MNTETRLFPTKSSSSLLKPTDDSRYRRAHAELVQSLCLYMPTAVPWFSVRCCWCHGQGRFVGGRHDRADVDTADGLVRACRLNRTSGEILHGGRQVRISTMTATAEETVHD